MKNLIIISLILFLIASCNKNKKVFVEGILMEDCNTPAANTPLIALQDDYNHALFSSDVWEEFTTNSQGYFRFEAKKNVTVHLNLKSQMTRLMNDIEIGNNNLNIGKVYSERFLTKHVINLDVQQPYTENDTLILIYKNNTSNPSYNEFKYYTGPFQSGILDTMENITFKGYPRTYSFEPSNDFQISYSFRIRSLPSLNKTTPATLNFNCSNEYNFTTLLID